VEPRLRIVWGIPKDYDKPVVLVTAYHRILGGGINLSRGGGNDESAEEIEVCT
jgi:hypothetical protein